MANIKFGTDGWRAIVGEDFNSQNVEIVTNAIGKYVFEKFGVDKKILIGFDPRNRAKEFAEFSAEILAKSGFNVFLSGKVVPTPVLAYNAQLHNACAIMFTASHNPPKYLGMKFIPDYAGPATNEITDEIVDNLGQKAPNALGLIKEYDFEPEYFEHLKTLINFKVIKNLKTTIIFDGLYSATIGYFDKFLDEFSIPYQSLHMEHDPNFGGGMPEPKPKYLKELIEKVKAEGNSVGLANDGDGDRFGIINENGEYVSPNEIIAILLLYLKNNRKMRGPLVKTVGASSLLDMVAEKIGVDVVETAVGFKHVGEAMRMFDPIIGGEESGGLSIQGHIPEKDGILANLLVLEAMGGKYKSLVELQEEIHQLAGANFFNELVNLKLENQEQIKFSLEKAKNIKKVGEFKVIKTDTKDGVKLYLSDNLSWILIRPSGTEPLLRIYFESGSLKKLEEIKHSALKLFS
ncbi:MAG: hypothetical protein WCY19_07040 [Candidatus Gastranaerophilaceae bacterium]